MAESDTNGKQTTRIVERGLIMAIGGISFFLWSTITDVKHEMARIAGIQFGRGDRIVKLESEQARYTQDIAEIKGTLVVISKEIQDLRLGMRQQQRQQ